MEKIEIKQVGVNEYSIGENKINLIDKNIIHVTAVGEQTDEIALLQKELHHRQFKLVEGKASFLIDLNKCGKNSRLARVIRNEIAEDENTFKIALFGLTSVSRVIASFVMGFSPKNNQRFFKTEEEAREWLAE